MFLLLFGSVSAATAGADISPCIAAKDFWVQKAGLMGADNFADLNQKAELLGQGGCGSVLTCGDHGSLALKIAIDPTDMVRASFPREMATYDVLGEHPCLPKTYGCFVGDKSAGLLLERLGPSLEKLRDAARSPRAGQNRRASPSRAGAPRESWLKARNKVERARVYRNLALIYDYAHSKGVCNNDVKPNNILQSLDDVNVFKAVDFGVACAIGKACGIHAYFFKAPEAYKEFMIDEGVFRGYPGADVWALLLTIYYMETDVRHFDFALIMSHCPQMNNVACSALLVAALRAHPNVSRLALIAVDIMAKPYQERNSMQVVVDAMARVINARRLPSPQKLVQNLFKPRKQ